MNDMMEVQKTNDQQSSQWSGIVSQLGMYAKINIWDGYQTLRSFTLYVLLITAACVYLKFENQSLWLLWAPMEQVCSWAVIC